MFKSKKSANLVFGKGLSSGHKMEPWRGGSLVPSFWNSAILYGGCMIQCGYWLKLGKSEKFLNDQQPQNILKSKVKWIPGIFVINHQCCILYLTAALF